MEVGEKYLSIKLCGHDFVVAFKNTKKTAPNQPDFKADGVAVWIKEKQAEKSSMEATTEDTTKGLF